MVVHESATVRDENTLIPVFTATIECVSETNVLYFQSVMYFSGSTIQSAICSSRSIAHIIAVILSAAGKELSCS